MKNTQIEQRMNAYFEGAECPQIDLAAAKREVRARRYRQRRGKVWAVLSACACIILAVALMPRLLPTQGNNGTVDQNSYSIASSVSVAATYSDLKEEYSAKIAPFVPFSLSRNASADYSLVELNGERVLIRIDIGYLSYEMQAQATVYIDLTNGEQEATELSDYTMLEEIGSGYSYQTTYEEAEYISKIYTTVGGAACYVNLTSNNARAVQYFMSLLR